MLTSVQGHGFALKLGSVGAEVRVTGFSLVEGLSSIPRAEVELVCALPDVSFDAVMDQDAALTIVDRLGVALTNEAVPYDCEPSQLTSI